jgi:anti-sigma-K factor RskA
MMEEHVYDLIPGYALGSLDEEELILVARHLPHCAACRRDLETYTETVEALAYAVPVVEPQQSLRERVVRRAMETALNAYTAVSNTQTTALNLQTAAQKTTPAAQKTTPAAQKTTPAAQKRSPERVPARPGIWGFFHQLFGNPLAMAAGLAVVIALLLVINSFVLSNRVKDLQAAAPVQGEMRLVRLKGTENAPQTVGYLMVFADEKYGTLAVENAAVLDPTQQYQIWLIKDGVRTSGGVFSVNQVGYGVLEIWSDQPLQNYQSFGITIEPAGGSPQPTGKKVLGGDL